MLPQSGNLALTRSLERSLSNALVVRALARTEHELEDLLQSKHSISERVGRMGDESTDPPGDLEKDAGRSVLEVAGVAGRAERMARHVWAKASEFTDAAMAEGCGEVTQDYVAKGAPGERAKRRLRGGAP